MKTFFFQLENCYLLTALPPEHHLYSSAYVPMVVTHYQIFLPGGEVQLYVWWSEAYLWHLVLPFTQLLIKQHCLTFIVCSFKHTTIFLQNAARKKNICFFLILGFLWSIIPSYLIMIRLGWKLAILLTILLDFIAQRSL